MLSPSVLFLHILFTNSISHSSGKLRNYQPHRCWIPQHAHKQPNGKERAFQWINIHSSGLSQCSQICWTCIFCTAGSLSKDRNINLYSNKNRLLFTEKQWATVEKSSQPRSHSDFQVDYVGKKLIWLKTVKWNHVLLASSLKQDHVLLASKCEPGPCVVTCFEVLFALKWDCFTCFEHHHTKTWTWYVPNQKTTYTCI